ncbi:hypothetical protein QBC47DRAFT_398980 [Echria macrotheca]|uniref:Heterokaryon incompatibility domain-containing protein n=1 Tax=Echria macrotheca TaxID=438768 RepID=A0AAJ0BGY6_9PEZI|nr:hypothetical protein QBC47DRAFT_398980 [Echria macrotheca]
MVLVDESNTSFPIQPFYDSHPLSTSHGVEHEQGEIRLLELDVHPPENTSMYGCLTTYPASRAKELGYSFLSYHVEDGAPHQAYCIVRYDDDNPKEHQARWLLSISSMLYGALSAFAASTKMPVPGKFFIPEICVNRLCNNEQIWYRENSAAIIGGAAAFVAWLGSSTEGTDRAFKTLRALRGQDASHYRKEIRNEIRRMLELPYWEQLDTYVSYGLGDVRELFAGRPYRDKNYLHKALGHCKILCGNYWSQLSYLNKAAETLVEELVNNTGDNTLMTATGHSKLADCLACLCTMLDKGLGVSPWVLLRDIQPLHTPSYKDRIRALYILLQASLVRHKGNTRVWTLLKELRELEDADDKAVISSRLVRILSTYMGHVSFLELFGPLCETEKGEIPSWVPDVTSPGTKLMRNHCNPTRYFPAGDDWVITPDTALAVRDDGGLEVSVMVLDTVAMIKTAPLETRAAKLIGNFQETGRLTAAITFESFTQSAMSYFVTKNGCSREEAELRLVNMITQMEDKYIPKSAEILSAWRWLVKIDKRSHDLKKRDASLASLKVSDVDFEHFEHFFGVLTGNRLITTKLDHCGLGPAAIHRGDILGAIAGCRLVVALRQRPGKGNEDKYSVVGSAYVDGCMFGERLKEENRPEIRVLTLY